MPIEYSTSMNNRNARGSTVADFSYITDLLRFSTAGVAGTNVNNVRPGESVTVPFGGSFADRGVRIVVFCSGDPTGQLVFEYNDGVIILFDSMSADIYKGTNIYFLNNSDPFAEFFFANGSNVPVNVQIDNGPIIKTPLPATGSVTVSGTVDTNIVSKDNAAFVK